MMQQRIRHCIFLVPTVLIVSILLHLAVSRCTARAAPRDSNEAFAAKHVISADSSADILLVTKTEDTADGACDADCSLREAINEANDRAEPATIVIGSGVYSLTLKGENDSNASGDLDILKSMTIMGAGSEKTIVDGSGLWNEPLNEIEKKGERVLDVYPGGYSSTVTETAVVAISGVTIRNGDSSGYICGQSLGGGIRAQATDLALSDVRLHSNNARCNVDKGAGGALFQIGGALTIENSAIEKNTSHEGGGLYFFAEIGGASSTVRLINSQVQNNNAHRGGGISVEGTTSSPPREPMTVTIKSSIVSSNVVTGTYYALGGGIHFNASHVFADKMIIEDSTLSGNRTILAEGGYGRSQGGAIYLTGADLTIRDSQVHDNIALPAVPLADKGISEGGGISIYDFWSDLTLDITDSRFSGNVSEIGGAVSAQMYRVQIADSTFAQNKSPGAADNGSAGFGGGIYMIGRGKGSSIEVQRSAIHDNEAGYWGGGLYVTSASAQLSECDIFNNSADEAGGGYHGGGTIRSCRIHHNVAKSGGGVGIAHNMVIEDTTIHDNTASDHGGGIYIAHVFRNGDRGGPDVFLRNVTVSGNIAAYGAGFSDKHPPPRGGSDPTSKSHFTNVTFADNQASVEGGGLFHYGKIGSIEDTEDPQKLTLLNTLLDGNQPFNCGGAMFAGKDTFISKGHNLSSDGSCEVTQSTDIAKTAGQIGPLADNGGTTHTHALLDSSPAIDAGTSVDTLSADQRGIERPKGAAPDIGSFEYEYTAAFLHVQPAHMTFVAVKGAESPQGEIEVRNSGINALSWQAISSMSWLSLGPTSGDAPATIKITPGHSGLAVGDYEAGVTITADGVDGSPQTVAISLTVVGMDAMIGNGNFESDSNDGWEQSSTKGRILIREAADIPYIQPRSGTRAAVLGEIDGEASELKQEIRIPPGDDIHLLFFGYIQSTETGCDNDKLMVRLGDNVLAEQPMCVSQNSEGWTEFRLPIGVVSGASAGDTLPRETLSFQVFNDHFSDPSMFILDDVMLIAGKDTNAPDPDPPPNDTPIPEPLPEGEQRIFLPTIVGQ